MGERAEFISCLDFVSIRSVPNYRHTPCYVFHEYHHNMATKEQKKKETREKEKQSFEHELLNEIGTFNIVYCTNQINSLRCAQKPLAKMNTQNYIQYSIFV